ncbi:MAG: helicase, partial [Spirochaetaceae bacterium]|nr:helicase [Spirochaetaceae bacterium]
FSNFIPIEPENKFDAKAQSFFSTFAIGVATNRDPWVYNFSKDIVIKNMKTMIGFYNEQRLEFQTIKQSKEDAAVIDYVDANPSKISWTRSLRNAVEKNITHTFDEKELRVGLYRPFTKQFLYYDRPFIESPGLWSQLFPNSEIGNTVICLSCVGTNNTLSALICETIPDLHFIGDTQCFPLYWYEKKPHAQNNLFKKAEDEYVRRDGVSDFILDQAQVRYGDRVTKEDIFYYVYGILHSFDYRKTFANDLKKMLPRLPLVEKPADFWAFSKAGRGLAELHLNYECQKKPDEVTISGAEHKDFTVTKMTFPAKGQKEIILYNHHITISNIPAKAYEYIVNGKSAIEWLMERYAVTTHKESGIKNNPNDWAIEHNNPRYILDLLLSVIAVSVKTMDIVNSLPKAEQTVVCQLPRA